MFMTQRHAHVHPQNEFLIPQEMLMWMWRAHQGNEALHNMLMIRLLVVKSPKAQQGQVELMKPLFPQNSRLREKRGLYFHQRTKIRRRNPRKRTSCSDHATSVLLAVSESKTLTTLIQIFFGGYKYDAHFLLHSNFFDFVANLLCTKM